MSIIKTILYHCTVFACLLIAAGCGEEDSKQTIPSPARVIVRHTLTYTAGDNGTISGISPQTVDHGSNAQPVTAVPDEHYHFADWSDGVSTAKRTDRNVTADLEVTAHFAINKYTMTYLTNENGVIDGINPQAIVYGDNATSVTAVPNEYYHFVDWSDGVNDPSRTDRNVAADLKVTANFEIDQYTLTYTAESHGAIEGASSQEVDHGGAGNTVTAVPTVGHHFVSWSDGKTTANRTDTDVTADLAFSAAFAVNQYALNYKAEKGGSIEGKSPQVVVHGDDGSPVQAVPDEHYHFVKWSDGISTADRTDSKVAKDLSVTARFAIDQHTLTYTAEENGSIKGVSSQKINHGGSGSAVTAVPDEGYHFATWDDNVATAKRTDSDITEDTTRTARFAINQYTLTYTAGENGSLEGANVQTVNHGSDAAAVTAVAQRGYHFVSWSDGILTARRHDSMVTSDLKVNAVFAVNTYTIGGSVSGLVEGTQAILQNNGGDDLTITADGNFVFATELLNAAGYEVTVLTQPTSPNQICTVTDGAGTVDYEDVTDIMVTCKLIQYTIGGMVSGIPANDRIILRSNNVDDLELSVNGSFTFAPPLDDGSTYDITVHSQPKRPNWDCTIENGKGNLTGANVNDVIVDCYPEAALQAVAGINKVKLNWNGEDFIELHGKEVAFNLCRAEEAIPPPPEGFRDCRSLKKSVFERKVDNPRTVLQLTNDTPYWFQVQVLAASGSRRTLSNIVHATPFGGLNDTGINWCADETVNHNTDGTRLEKVQSCNDLAETYPGQDALYGQDALANSRKLTKIGTGSAGFDFTRVCRNGVKAGEEGCPPNPSVGMDPDKWACTLDNITGLTWELKVDGGLHNKENTYTWYNKDGTVNGGDPGSPDGGKCEDSGCDTQAYIQAVNKIGLCGANDWRLPTKRELLSIVDNSRFKPATDTRFFPNTLSSYYWSSSLYPDQENSAWQIYFLYGEASPINKNKANRIRLVRGRTVTFGLDNP